MKCSIIETCSASADRVVPPPEFAAKLRRADAHIIMAVAAAHQVLDNHRRIVGSEGDLCGLVFASAFGPMEINFEVLDQVVFGQPISPTLFSHSVFNGAAGYIASILGIRGSSLSITDFGFPFFRSLELARVLLAGSELKACLVVQVETYSRLLEDARKTHAPAAGPWRSGGACWLLKKEEDESVKALLLDSLEVNEMQGNTGVFPTAGETLTVNGHNRICSTGLETVSALGEAIRAESDEDFDCRIESAAGTVSLRLRRQL